MIFQGGSSTHTTHTLTIDEMPYHKHDVGVSVSISESGDHSHDVNVRNDGNPDGWGDKTSSYERQYWNTGYNQYSQKYNLKPSTAAAGNHSHTASVNVSESFKGSNTPFSIMPPYLGVYVWRRVS